MSNKNKKRKVKHKGQQTKTMASALSSTEEAEQNADATQLDKKIRK